MSARSASLVLALGLAACAALPPEPPAVAPLASVPAAFELSGRIAVREGDHSEIAGLRWTRSPPRDTWVLTTPLGSEIARIESGPSGATLSQANGETQAAPSFQALTRRVLGVALDPDWLAAGLYGQPQGAAPPGWELHVDETQAAGAVRLARRLTARNGEVVVRLAIDSFHPLGE